jgi:uncharacterized protein YyaL (SSP411 family)
MLRDGVLHRRFRDGETAVPGFLDDYACMAQAQLDLYEATFDARDLRLAIELTRKMLDLFEDRESGGFFSASGDDPHLVMRIKDDYDGAEPAGNSIAALNLLRLAAITGDPSFLHAAERTLQFFARKMSEQPMAAPQLLVAYMWSIGKPMQVILGGGPDAADTKALADVIRHRFLPNRVLAMASDAAPDARSMGPIDGHAAAYLCENFTCQLPETSPEKLQATLDELLK